MGVNIWRRLLTALAGAVCAPHLKHLWLDNLSLDSGCISKLSELLPQDTFPELETLSLDDNPDIRDDGVISLVRGLVTAWCLIRLRKLSLIHVRMGNPSMELIARLVPGAEISRNLRNLDISGNDRVSNKGICALAPAVKVARVRWLPKLQGFMPMD